MSVKSQREMLEAAIAADFDDLAAHAAYADLLAESGDPRGEYIQLRLALEDQNQSPRLLREWEERATALLRRHERDWLGSLAPFLLDRPRPTVEPVAPNIEFTFRRGWVAELDVQDVRHAFTTVLARAPEIRMLQALTLRNTGGPIESGPLESLLTCPYFGTVKSFALGDPEAYLCSANGSIAVSLVQKMTQLRELDLRAYGVGARLFAQPLPHVRSLHVDFLGFAPLRALAENASLTNLERLFLWVREAAVPPERPDPTEVGEPLPQAPDEFAAAELRPFLAAPQFGRLTTLALRTELLGDVGCAEIAQSGVLRRLTRLDLRNCGITDAGAEALARSQDLGHLEWLDVGANRLTPAGVARLQEAEIRVQWDSQWGEYLQPDRDDVIV
ncbi:MAG: TIGR02996 domain-containing protein [Zavarzinella sp.]|nr:TIGR02996 domain-containing protein [Zavarzinella sp.]